MRKRSVNMREFVYYTQLLHGVSVIEEQLLLLVNFNCYSYFHPGVFPRVSFSQISRDSSIFPDFIYSSPFYLVSRIFANDLHSYRYCNIVPQNFWPRWPNLELTSYFRLSICLVSCLLCCFYIELFYYFTFVDKSASIIPKSTPLPSQISL